jgi:low temperature requirement protein LtrA
MRALIDGTAAGLGRFRRDRSPGEEARATTLELFYDLVFVFAITQVSHILLKDLTWRGAAETILVLAVVWWAWNYTTWVTNELDPDSVVVRLLLLGLMLASLVMAVAIPEAFGDRGMLFAAAYVTIQVGRHLFLTFASAAPGTIERERAARILVWLTASGVFWIAGGAADDATTRAVLWAIALAIDYGAPAVVYWVPGRPQLTSESWNVETAHFAERFQLFVIIALGETIVITGATTSELEIDSARVVAFGLAFLSTAAMWWLYFNYVAAIAQRRLEVAPNRTLLARDGYTYLHVVLVAGIVIGAVGDELVIAHPTDVLPTAEVIVVAAGPAIYLLGHSLFRYVMAGSFSEKRLVGAAACVPVALLGLVVPALVLASLLVGVLVAVIVWERVAAARREARGEPTPLERLDAQAAVAAQDPET